jgi:hypothetical protein
LSVSVLSLAIGKLAFLKEQGVYCKQDWYLPDVKISEGEYVSVYDVRHEVQELLGDNRHSPGFTDVLQAKQNSMAVMASDRKTSGTGNHVS